MKHLKTYESLSNDPFNIINLMKSRLGYADEDIADINNILTIIDDDDNFNYSVFPSALGEIGKDHVILVIYNETTAWHNDGDNIDKLTDSFYNICIQVSDRLSQLGFCKNNPVFSYGYNDSNSDYIDGKCFVRSQFNKMNCKELWEREKENDFILEKMVLNLYKV